MFFAVFRYHIPIYETASIISISKISTFFTMVQTREYVYRIKVHLIATEESMPVEYEITPASSNDVDEYKLTSGSRVNRG